MCREKCKEGGGGWRYELANKWFVYCRPLLKIPGLHRQHYTMLAALHVHIHSVNVRLTHSAKLSIGHKVTVASDLLSTCNVCYCPPPPQAVNLEVDESSFTGETIPSRKSTLPQVTSHLCTTSRSPTLVTKHLFIYTLYMYFLGGFYGYLNPFSTTNIQSVSKDSAIFH